VNEEPKAPTTLVLLRHGETALTPQGRFSGSGGNDPALSEVGLRQAEQAAVAAAVRAPVRAILSSPLWRCRETAVVVSACLDLPLHVEDRLREADFGAWEGLTFAEARERHPEEFTAWRTSSAAAPPGGEPFDAVAQRVTALRNELVARYPGGTVLLVSHVGPIRTLLRLALEAPPQTLFRMNLAAASLSEIACHPDGTAVVQLLNDTSHLRQHNAPH
jgi:broad specificity phosphatase PhoE